MDKLYATKIKIIVSPMEKPKVNTTVGGIVLPDNVNKDELIKIGKVIKVGNSASLPIDIFPGDIVTVMYHAHYAQEVTIDNKLFHIFTEDDILCLIKE